MSQEPKQDDSSKEEEHSSITRDSSQEAKDVAQYDSLLGAGGTNRLTSSMREDASVDEVITTREPSGVPLVRSPKQPKQTVLRNMASPGAYSVSPLGVVQSSTARGEQIPSITPLFDEDVKDDVKDKIDQINNEKPPALVSKEGLQPGVISISGDPTSGVTKTGDALRLAPATTSEGVPAPATPSRPGAVTMRGNQVYYSSQSLDYFDKSDDTFRKQGLQSEKSVKAIAAVIAPDSLQIEEERDALRRQLDEERQHRNQAIVVEAVTQESKDSKTKPSESNRKKIVVFVAILLVLAVAGVVLGVLLVGGDKDGQEVFFDQIGDSIDGQIQYTREGSSLALSQDGTIMAIANVEGVEVYQRSTDSWVRHPQRLAPEGCVDTGLLRSGLNDNLSFALRSDVVVDLSKDGNYIAIGCPLASSTDGDGTEILHSGKVIVYRNVGDDWQEIMTSQISGDAEDIFLGSSISINHDGSRLAVGAVGSQGYVQVYTLIDDLWVPMGSPIASSELMISIGSISLSSSGDVMAIGGLSSEGGDAVARVYRFESDKSWPCPTTTLVIQLQPKADSTMRSMSEPFRGRRRTKIGSPKEATFMPRLQAISLATSSACRPTDVSWAWVTQDREDWTKVW